MWKSARVVPVVAMFALVAPAAHAAPITWTFETEVTFVAAGTSYDPYRPLLGAHVTGTFTFDSEAPDGLPDPGIGRYATGAWVIELSGLDSVWTFDEGYIEIVATGVYSPWCAGDGCLTAATFGPATSSNPTQPPPLFGFEFRMFGLGLLSDALTLLPPASAAPGWQFEPGFGGGVAGGPLALDAAQTVPEPTALALCAVGLAGLLVPRRFRRTTSRR